MSDKIYLDRETLLSVVQESGAEYEECSKFYRVGPKAGPHLMVSRAKKVTKVFGYGVVVDPIPGILFFTEEERKAQKLGGITHQIDMSSGQETALAAFRALVDAVRPTDA